MLAVLDKVTAACAGTVLTPRRAGIAVAAVLTLIALMRVFLYSGTDADDAEQLIYSQDWAWGYGRRSPPLFTWLVIAMQQVAGVTVASVVVLKFMLLGASYFLIYLSAKRILQDERLAVLATLSPLAIYYVSWDAAFHYTHSVLLVFAICLTLYMLLRVEERGDTASFVLFGATVGIGLIAKYNYILFAAALLIAAGTDQALRGRLLQRRLLLSAAVAAAAALPHYLWLWQQRAGYAVFAKDRFTPTGGIAQDFNLAGLTQTVSAGVNFLLPMAIFLIAFFPRACWRDGNRDAPSARYRRVLGLTFVMIIAAAIVGVLILGISHIRIHYMFLLVLFPVYFFARVQASEPSTRSLRFYATVLAALVVILPTGAAVKYFVDPQRGSKAYYNMPYADFARQLKAAGFTHGTIIGDWLGYPLAGNLRPYFPESRLISLLDWQFDVLWSKERGPLIAPRTVTAPGQCLLVWTPQEHEDRRKMLVRTARLLTGATLKKSMPASGILSAPMQPGGERRARIGYLLVPEGSGDCR